MVALMVQSTKASEGDAEGAGHTALGAPPS